MNNDNHLENSWNQLIFKFLEGKCSLLEENELQKWLDENPANSELFGLYRNAWLSTSAKASSNLFDSAKAWQHIETSIPKPEINTGKKHSFISGTGIQYFLKIAALIVFIFLAGFLSSRLFNKKSTATDLNYCIVNTPLGSRTRLILPDNSEVWLNAGSTLTYPTQFERKNRKVTLTGEAFFKVKTDKSRPFIVSTSQVNVRALGTSFNVKAYPEDDLVTATLVEGTIKVDGIGKNNKFSYTLEPNQNLTVPVKRDEPSIARSEKVITGSKIIGDIETRPKVEAKSEAVTEALVSWKDERWTIQGETLSSLAVLLERRYNIKIHLSSDLLNAYRFSGTIQNETFEQVLQYLRYTTPLKFEVGKGEVWWDIDPELATSYSKILNKK